MAEKHRRSLAEESLLRISVREEFPQVVSGAVLVDAMWDNPNHWFRYALLRGAAGLSKNEEVGVIGPHRRRQQLRTLQRFGIRCVEDLDHCPEGLEPWRSAAERMVKDWSLPEDILCHQLPGDLPSGALYDGLLKAQRATTVELNHPVTIPFIADALWVVDQVRRIFDSHAFGLVVVSHPTQVRFAALSAEALRRGIPTVVLYGAQGLLRFSRPSRDSGCLNLLDRPSPEDLSGASEVTLRSLRDVGFRYIQNRLAGGADDLGARYAFRGKTDIDRATIVQGFLRPEQPLVSLYASNWFDFPHAHGMDNFQDFWDWIQVTIQTVKEVRDVNWLIRAHPSEVWYGGVKLSKVVDTAGAENICLADPTWSGGSVTAAADALVTCHGTAGVEYASLGKPVLLADRGWYHDCGFATVSETREEYITHLLTGCWLAKSTVETKNRALAFAGWYFGRPAWQSDFVLEDDPSQASIYATIPKRLKACEIAVQQEQQMIGRWLREGERGYHTMKMRYAEHNVTV